VSANSSIQWTDKTWNPTRGCSIVSPGCVNCYAMKQAHRFSGPGKPYAGLTKQTKAGPQWTGNVATVESSLLEPLSWRKPARVFVNSMSDLFHEDVPEWFIDEVFAVMALAERHTFQILTKRAERMRAYFAADRYELIARVETRLWNLHTDDTTNAIGRWPLPNVWLGVSVENQQYADERIPLLLQTPAAVRFISAEPLLGPVDLNGLPDPKSDPSWDASALHGVRECAFGATVSRESINKLDWVIVGGESGPGARPFDLAWARSIVQQCKAAGVPCFMKQLGSAPLGIADRISSRGARGIPKPDGFYRFLNDRKGGNPDEWPEDLRVREFPPEAA
jgi:protein gp37